MCYKKLNIYQQVNGISFSEMQWSNSKRFSGSIYPVMFQDVIDVTNLYVHKIISNYRKKFYIIIFQNVISSEKVSCIMIQAPF